MSYNLSKLNLKKTDRKLFGLNAQRIVLLAAILMLALSSQAQLKKFKVEVPNPAKFKISDSIQSFTILNRSLTSEFSNYNEDSLQIGFYRKNFTTNTILLDSMVSDTIVKVLGDLLFDSERFDIVIPVERNINRETTYIKTLEPLDWDYVNAVCETFETDALIVLENFATRVVSNYEKRYNYDYGFSETVHYASMDFYYRAHWRIYYPKTKMILVDFIMNQDTIFWDNFDYDLVELFKGLPSVKDANVETGIKIALDFSEVIAPSWEEASRYYYVMKNPLIDKSVSLASEGKWDEALVNWLEYTDKGSSTNRSKIMLNVALAYEMVGDLPKAIEWTKESQNTYYREVTNHYLKELLKRELKLKK